MCKILGQVLFGIQKCLQSDTCVLSCFSCVWLLVTLWTVALQAPLSMGFPRQEYWSGLPFSSLGNLPDPGIEQCLLCLLHWQAGSLSLVPPGKPIWHIADCIKHYNKAIIKLPWEYGEGKIEIRIMERRSLNREFELDLNELVGLIGVFKNKMHLSWVQKISMTASLIQFYCCLAHFESFSLNPVICEAFLVHLWAFPNITLSLTSFPRAGNLRIQWKLKMVWEWECW